MFTKLQIPAIKNAKVLVKIYLQAKKLSSNLNKKKVV